MGFGLAVLVLASVARPVLAGYVPDWGYSKLPNAALSQVTDVYYFSVQPNADASIDFSDINVANLRALASIKKNKEFRLILCVGGWERSKHFAPVTANESLRAALVENLVRTCDQFGLDGIDLDWEHPQTDKEASDYARLMVELKLALGPSRLLTAAMAGWQKLPQAGIDALDRLNLMAYDHEGEHSTLEQAKADVEAAKKLGFSPSKIVLGVPFYGRDVQNFDVEMSLRDILAKYKPKPDEDMAGNFYFNNQSTLIRKCEYIKSEKLGGAMVWELTQDTAKGEYIRILGSLLGTARSGNKG